MTVNDVKVRGGLLVDGSPSLTSEGGRLVPNPAAGNGNDSNLNNTGSNGNYWSSTPNSDNSNNAWNLNFNSSNFNRNNNNRYNGPSVRPLRGFADVILSASGTIGLGVTSHFAIDCRAGARPCSADGVLLRYDANWAENETEVRLIDNGVVLTNDIAGVYVWKPAPCSSMQQVFKLEILSGEEVVQVETAEFACDEPTAEHAPVISSPAVEPTCGTPGHTDETRCSCCGEIVQAATEIPALGYVRNVSARQVKPWQGLVEIGYEIADEIPLEEGAVLLTSASIEDRQAGMAYGCSTFTQGPTYEVGPHTLIWDAAADGVLFVSADAVIRVSLTMKSPTCTDNLGAASSEGVPLDLTSTPVLANEAVDVVVEYGTNLFVEAADRVEVKLDGKRLGSFMTCGVLTQRLERAGTYDFELVAMTNRRQAVASLTATYILNGPAAPELTPADGYVFTDESMTVKITAAEGATIYYTLDGTEPSTNSTKLTKKLRLTEKTEVKAIAVIEGQAWSPTASALYAKGNAAAPVISLTDGAVFTESDTPVTISWNTEDGVVRYTLDGREPTAESPLYEGPFTISSTCTIKAKVFSDHYFDSAVATSSVTRKWLYSPTPVISPNGGNFVAGGQEIVISCANSEAELFYTIDGSDPTVSGRRYTGPFTLYWSATIKAVSLVRDCTYSAVASAVFTKTDAVGAALNTYREATVNDATYPWVVDTAVSHDGESSLRSGAIADTQKTKFEITVTGAGSLSFWWKTACEEPMDGDYYDFASFWVDNQLVARLADVTDWQQVLYTIAGDGAHTLRWQYEKDDSYGVAPDCAWIDQFVWQANGETGTYSTPVSVPYAWLEGYGLGVTTDFERAANVCTGKRDALGQALFVYDDYVAGTDPTNSASIFTSTIDMSSGTPVITWSPDLNEGGKKDVRVYRTYGATSPIGPWTEVKGDEANYNFFKVTVEMK